MRAGERDGMTGPVSAGAAGTALIRPAAGLVLLGEYQGGGFTESRFLVRRGDGQFVQLSLLPYLVTMAIAEGGTHGGWDAAQVAARAGADLGRELTADNIRYLVDRELAPLAITAAGDPDRPPDGAPGAAPAPRAHLLPGSKMHGARPLPGYRTRRWPITIGGTGVLAAAAAVALVVAGTGNRETGGAASVSVSVSASSAGASSAAASSAAASSAAAWVAQQVSPDMTVSCDPRMCRQIQRDGFPAARLKPLPSTARDPLGTAVVVATAAVRSQYGATLAAEYAPEVIASFGSGASRVDIRLVAPDGAAAFRAQLAAEHAALVSAGRQLLDNMNIQPSPSARAALRAGQVDARLLAILAMLSHQMPVTLVAFTAAPGTSAGAPLRGAEISASSPAARSAILAFLNAQDGPYRPATATVSNSADGAPAVALRFDAPTPADAAQP
jgi:hypothetical protein